MSFRWIIIVFVIIGDGGKAIVFPSTFGEKTAGTDYASYHSHFHSHDVNVRYVVVPFHEDANVMNQAAAASLIRAIINPDGDGWY